MTSANANIVELFDARVAADGNAPALIDAADKNHTSVTFQQLQTMSLVMARQLRADGVVAGQRVLVAVPVSVSLYALLLALWRLGAVAVFPDPSAPRAQLNDCCRRLHPGVFIGIARAHLLRLLLPAVRAIGVHYHVGGWLPLTRRLRVQGEAGDVFLTASDEQSPALITFTSGSTARPKVACRSHGFLTAQYRVIQRTLRLLPGERDITTLPVFVLANLAAGVTTVLPPGDLRRPGSVAAEPILAAMARHGVTRASGSPAFFAQLCRHWQGDEPLLQQLYTGGAPVTPAMMEEFSVLAKDVVAVYGSTEAEPIAELPSGQMNDEHRTAPLAGRGLPAGIPVPEIDLRIIRARADEPVHASSMAELDALRCPTGEAGEIVVSGDHVLPGYLNGEGNEETKFSVDGRVWHRTGDAGYLDDRGELWLLGRLGASVKYNEKVLYPFAVEYPVMASPDVERAALTAVNGQPVLAVQFSAAATHDRENALTKLNLPEWFPREWVRPVPAIPLDRRHNAKIDYGALKVLLTIKM